MKNFYAITSLLSLSLLLSGCDSVRNTLGLDHYQADAFAVPTNPPLVLPPSYNLTPPKPGAAPTHAQTSETKAQSVLQVEDAKVHSGSGTEKQMMQNAQVKTPENIRELVDKEAADEATLEGKLNKQVKSWKEQAKENFESIKGEKKPETEKHKEG